MFANRLRENLTRLGKIARREEVSCWRLYDADMPEYALAVDLYTGAGPDEGKRWLYVQEYAPPATIEPAGGASAWRKGAGRAAGGHGCAAYRHPPARAPQAEGGRPVFQG